MKNEAKLTRAFYIIVVPVVLLMLVLNSGMLQRMLQAVTVDGEEYTGAQYNYYYFQVYQEFVETDYNPETYNLNASASHQYYDADTTYKEYFSDRAYKRMVLSACYDRMAKEAGYEFSEYELAPAAEEMAEIDAFCAETGIAERNYFSAYYGAGMTREIFEAELLREARAAAYRAHLMESMEWTESEVDSWLLENPTEDYSLADLWIIELNAVPARADGQVGERQLNDLEQRLARLDERWKCAEMTMQDLVRYADKVWGEGGFVTDAARDDLPAVVADWCFGTERGGADHVALMDRENGLAYLVHLTDENGSYAHEHASEMLAEAALAELEAELLLETAVEFHKLGMQFTTN